MRLANAHAWTVIDPIAVEPDRQMVIGTDLSGLEAAARGPIRFLCPAVGMLRRGLWRCGKS